ncbi:MAG: 3-deoxy-7-phosphoheptulonate synthase [Candidatus Eisenbacteria bacterium]|jgi:3-deoxy-7-phosphoheptulonate synthase|nr:3-deoxy-7-phosphoheptulonate synthase [Candidatus Eisenbacteria bacterium]
MTRLCPVLTALKASVGIPDDEPLIIAGPCAVESESMFDETVQMLVEHGIRFVRAGIFKPRTSPFTFQGMGEDALEVIGRVAAKYAVALVSEVMESEQIPILSTVASVLQVGTRNMDNYALLKRLGCQPLPVLLKRGFMADSKEFFLAAEYVRREGNERVVLCERGIRTFESATRNTLDLNVVPIARLATDLPIIVDPSHGTGRSDIVIPMARAAIAAGADGLMVEVHPNPPKALSDGLQSLDFERFAAMLQEVRAIYAFVGEGGR